MIMTRKHCKMLTKGFKLSVLVKFEDFLMKWQEAQRSSHHAESTVLINKGNFVERNKASNVLTDKENYMERSPILFNLNKVLTNSMRGRSILLSYQNNTFLTDAMRSIVLDLIINFLLQENIKMSVLLASQISFEIIKCFPTEAKV